MPCPDPAPCVRIAATSTPLGPGAAREGADYPMPPTFTQAGRPITIDTPLGADALLLNGFTGSEVISAPFRFHLDLLAPASAPVTFANLLGQSVTVHLT